MGKRFGQLSRLTLTYDFTFVALLHMALCEQQPDFTAFRCHTSPLRKKMLCKQNQQLEFAADAAMAMFYYQVKDSVADSRFFKKLGALLLLPIASHYRKKSRRHRPQLDELVGSALAAQLQIERQKTPSADLASQPSAQALGELLALLANDEPQRRILHRLGYLMGRYVYLCDALDDLQQDLREHNYNPFLIAHGLTAQHPEEIPAVVQQATGSLYLTIAEIEKTFDLLTLYHYQPILTNIIQEGLRSCVDRIRLKKENQS